jgi:hypothetical protein
MCIFHKWSKWVRGWFVKKKPPNYHRDSEGWLKTYKDYPPSIEGMRQFLADLKAGKAK